jgi:disulfide oxidoreductase YuzD
MMKKCFRCGAETENYHNGFPTCAACLDTPTAQTTPTWLIMRLPNGTQLKLPYD